MSRGIPILLAAQFLTAFADNAILFTAIAMLFESPRGDWYGFYIDGFSISTISSNSYFAWDFSAVDSQFLVTSVSLFIPEPSTLLLAVVGALARGQVRVEGRRVSIP